jgi:AcrR family transcriptional regulator
MASGDEPKRLGRPLASSALETRERLMEEARRSFANLGYEGTTNRAIADAVGITTGAIYHYFPSKVDMYSAVYAEVQDVLFSAMEIAARKERGFVNKVTACMRALVAITESNASLAGFVVGVTSDAQRHPEVQKAIQPVRDRATAFYRSLAREAISAGEVQDGVTQDVLADLVLVLVAGLARHAALFDDNNRTRRVVEGVERLSLGNLLK